MVAFIDGISQILFQILAVFFQTTHDYGISVILLACAVKLILTPLTQQQFKSMKEMQAIQPEMLKLQARYKDDPQAQQKAVLDLYKTHKINPLGGCLPLLFQMPILFAIWRTIGLYQDKFSSAAFLWVSSFSQKMTELFPGITRYLEIWRGQCDITSHLKHKFPLWGDSLASPDILLLLLYVLSMILSSKMTPISATTQDPAQLQTQKMMSTVMPVMFAVMLISTPSAFVLYWFVFNLLSIVHQYYAMKTPYRLEHIAAEHADKQKETKTAQDSLETRPRKRGRKKEAQAP